ncbi:hypothetical protein DFH08DRAFT_242692 [Mycena albidolilacea]|uniref:Uncharacterized protein n=1 Tax=Mycena albidolilacea TaxID=1033008 RepID=A0AAD6ZVX0_9AGAR|nr:hypothetical protein DFH08DRAFT_242692 [Mycena albidolilacea]
MPPPSLLDTSCPLNDSQAPMHATPDPRPRHVRCTINAPPYDCVLAALVTRLGLRCGYERVWLHLPSSFTPCLASPAFAHPSLLPFFALRAIPSPRASHLRPRSLLLSPPSPSRPAAAAPCQPHAQSHIGPARPTALTFTHTHARADAACSRPGIVLRSFGITADKCDVKPTLHTPPASCSRSPLLFPLLSYLPHLSLSSRMLHAPLNLPSLAPYTSPLPQSFPRIRPRTPHVAAGHTLHPAHRPLPRRP